MPIMCDGSNFSNGNRKPVALVKIVNRRNIAVIPGIRLEPRSPNMTIMPETIAIRLMITCTVVKVDKLIPRIMTRSPFLNQPNATTPDRKLPQARVRAIQVCGDPSKKTPRDVQLFCVAVLLRGCHKPRQHCDPSD